MVVYVGAYFISQTMTFGVAVESRGGYLMDTWCAYLATRFIVTDRSKLISVIKCISIVLVPLAILGVIESVTHWQPFAPLWVYSPWFRGGRFISEGRFGFARAVGPFSMAILFGGAFAMFLPLVYYLRYEKKEWHTLAYILSGIALLGALSSMSSGPWVMVIVVIFCLVMERHKKFVKPLFILLVVMCLSIGIASNRPFYHVIASWANPLGGAGWHRAKLIDIAIEHFSEWWMIGYGDKDPGWGPQLGMGFSDITNEYIIKGVRYGLLGIIALCAVLAKAFRDVISTYRKVKQPAMKSLCWAFGSLLFSVTIAWMSVSFFGQLTTLLYCSLGMIGSLSSPKFNWQIPNRISLVRNRPARMVS
ncbi:MAG TPA: hypothetical protein DIU00_20380 [Phycisphaerales bacterium]|nr:hypothetical protein [Phycisphaerales bacterium]